MSTALFVRSVYSLLKSTLTVPAMVKKAAEDGFSSLALVDNNVLAGAMAFKKECAKYQLKPLYGLDFKASYQGEDYPVVLYARNDEGFKELIVFSNALMKGEHLDLVEVAGKSANCFLALMADDCPFSKEAALKTLTISRIEQVRADLKHFMVAIADCDIAYNRGIRDFLKPLLKECGIRTFALNRTFYLQKEDVYEYEILRCIDNKTLIKDLAGVYETGRYFLSPDEYAALYDHDDLMMAELLASRCNVELAMKTSLPRYPLKLNVSAQDYLRALCYEGLRRRLHGQEDQRYRQRLNYELDVIIKMDFTDYFLIVYDFILFAKKNNILVGPGRGSAAGSLVAYCLGITEIDPIRYGLLFERFLNPERVSMPDIDTDFPDDRRDEVIAYVKSRYGEQRVAHIITYGTLKARQVLRDVGRVMNRPNFEMDALCKLVPATLDMTLRKAYAEVPAFKHKIDSSKELTQLFKSACALEGNPRHISTHAAGIVMSQKPLSEVVPLVAIEKDLYSTQYTMEHLEQLGLIKMDFLGLRNLSIIAEVCREAGGLDIRKIPMNDSKTLKLIADVDTLGIFQLESPGMMNLLGKLKPNCFEDIAVAIALFRPGPMENIPLYIQNRANPQAIVYLHKDLIPILKETYGVIIYQEQIMSISRLMAGFSYGKADILRRAMSKKKEQELLKMKGEFIEGCRQRGYDQQLAEKVYELILRFANYGFNKSHSIAYGMVAYQMAYLKANYPLFFYKSLLNGALASTSKTYEYFLECEGRGVKVLSPDLNRSADTYQIVGSAIIMPLSVVKEVGSSICKKIENERRERGVFKSYLDAVVRLVRIGVDKGAIASLICAGAFDGFAYSRYTMLQNLTSALMYAETHRNEGALFDLDDEPLIREYRDDLQMLAYREKEALGFYFSYNPIRELRNRLDSSLQPLISLKHSYGFQRGLGLIRTLRQHRTKRGDLMAFIEVSDDTGDLSLVVMPDLYKRYLGELKKGANILFSGNIEKEGSLLVKKLEVIADEQNTDRR